jgi:phospholipid/cholesterol/gamma-HCH transport system substrate-binding protein
VRRAHADLVVGTFVVSAAALMLWGTLLVGARPGLFDEDAWTFTARFDNVSGLNEETDVSIAGVSVGTVSGIALDGARARVTVRIDDPDVEIPVDSVVAIRSRGMLGEKVLEIEPGRSPVMLDSGHVLTATRSTGSLDTLIDRLTAVADDVHQVSTSFRNVLGDAEGEEAIREVVANARAVSGDLRRFVEDNGERFESTAKNLDAFAADLAALTDENRAAVHEVIGGLRDTSERLHAAVDHLAAISERLEKGEGTLGRLLADDDVYLELDRTVEEARAALREVRRAAEETQEQVPATILTTLLGSLF